jgi:hypothetical protein
MSLSKSIGNFQDGLTNPNDYEMTKRNKRKKKAMAHK